MCKTYNKINYNSQKIKTQNNCKIVFTLNEKIFELLSRDDHKIYTLNSR